MTTGKDFYIPLFIQVSSKMILSIAFIGFLAMLAYIFASRTGQSKQTTINSMAVPHLPQELMVQTFINLAHSANSVDDLLIFEAVRWYKHSHDLGYLLAKEYAFQAFMNTRAEWQMNFRQNLVQATPQEAQLLKKRMWQNLLNQLEAKMRKRNGEQILAYRKPGV